MSNGYKSALSSGGGGNSPGDQLDYANKVIRSCDQNGSGSYTTSTRGVLFVYNCVYVNVKTFTIAGKQCCWGRSDVSGNGRFVTSVDSGVTIVYSGITSFEFIPYVDQTHNVSDWANAVSIGDSLYEASVDGICFCSAYLGNNYYMYNNIKMYLNSYEQISFILPMLSGDTIQISGVSSTKNINPRYFIPYKD